MNRFRIAAALALTIAVWFASAPAAQGDRCTAARDLLRQTREGLRPGASQKALEDAVLSLQRATELCPGLGDAYYFLSLIGDSLKDPRAENWRAKAQFYDSPAFRSGESLFPGVERGPVEPRTTGGGTPGPDLSAPPISPFVKRRLALVVGISRFRDPGIQALHYTSADAKSVADALRQGSQFDYVKTLLDEDATLHNILTEIDQLARMAEPDDLVVLYISSHGSPENLDTAGVNYIVTYDTEVNNLYPTAYEMDNLLRDINQRIKAARVVAFLDTCYSGGTFRELPADWSTTSRSLASDVGVSSQRLQESLQRGAKQLIVDKATAVVPSERLVPQGIGRVIITSSSQSEKSWEDERIAHGYFTYFLLQALQKKGPVSVDQIYADLRVRVPEAVQRDKRAAQHPGIAEIPDHANLYLNDRIP